MQETEYINVYGARVHNLKDIDAEIPRNSLTVITGLSGSGKSSLAFDTIQAGETLYKLTTMYNVSAKDICEANPGLSAENFRIGQVILIPQKKEEQTATATQTPTEQTTIQGPVVPKCKDMHKVKRKETIFSVSREYGISEQELIAANPELKKGMKKGQFLCISVSMIRISMNWRIWISTSCTTG